PPQTFTAPISVMASSAGDPPVVSRSKTTNVTSCSGVPGSSRVPCTASTAHDHREARRHPRRRWGPDRRRERGSREPWGAAGVPGPVCGRPAPVPYGRPVPAGIPARPRAGAGADHPPRAGRGDAFLSAPRPHLITLLARGRDRGVSIVVAPSPSSRGAGGESQGPPSLRTGSTHPPRARGGELHDA